jgi:hypothetical protein
VNRISQGVFLLNTPATRGSVGWWHVVGETRMVWLFMREINGILQPRHDGYVCIMLHTQKCNVSQFSFTCGRFPSCL